MSVAAGHRVSWQEDLGAFLVTGFDEAQAVLRGSGWTSDPRLSPLAPPEVRTMPGGLLVFLDPPEHTRVRRLLNPVFTPTMVQRLRPRVTAIVDAVLDGLDADAPVDVVSDVAAPVPIAVIAELFDIGIEGAQLFHRCTGDLVRLLEVSPSPADLTASASASVEATLFLTPILAQRQQNPGDDYISALLAVQGEPDGLSLQEVLATCVLLVAAGHETTTGLIANATHALLTHPDQRQHLFDNPDRAVAELLRLEGPAKLVGRTALTDHNLDGIHIAAGTPVFVHLQEANRDPRRFADPRRLDLTRTPVGQLAFGSGPHFCLGAALARLESVETLTRVFRRYPDLALTDGPVTWSTSTTFHRLTELPVHLRG